MDNNFIFIQDEKEIQQVLAYSYDIINQSMSNYISGLNAHEITLTFKINQAEKKGVKSAPSIY